MIRSIVTSAAAAALIAGAAQASPASTSMGVAWLISPDEGFCRAEIELAGRSGAVVPVTLTSDGSIISMRFAKDDLPERAFLPVRVDRARFSNLMLRGADGRSGELILSEETVQALRRGASLDIAWLGQEPVGAPLAGSEQALSDLRVCGAQAAGQHHARLAAAEQARERGAAEERNRKVTEAQLAAARAQKAAADAEARRLSDEAERQRRAEAEERERGYYAERQRAYDAERQRAYDDAEAQLAYDAAAAARRAAYEDAQRRRYYYYQERWAPPPPVYRGGYRPF